MADGTKIEWTEATWNPIRARLKSDPSVIGWHCEHASPGCVNCYSETRNLSGRCNLGTRLPFKPGHRKDVEVYLDEKVLLQPLHWKKPRLIFPCSMTDLFGAFVTDEMLDRVFAVMALCPQHTFQVLTKRSARMREYLTSLLRPAKICPDAVLKIPQVGRDIMVANAMWPLPNVWLGVSVEDQQRADERIADLLATPAAVRWLSCEPLLGALSLRRVERNGSEVETTDWLTRAWQCADGDHFRCGHIQHGIDWIVCGGESGPGARPMHPDWARSLRDQCAAAGVPFFFKQWGEWSEVDQFDPSSDSLYHWNRERFGELRFRSVAIGQDGRTGPRADDLSWPTACIYQVGKKRAGRLLDGVTHDAMPEAAHV